MLRPRLALVSLALVAIAVVAIAAGCGSDDDRAAAPATTAAPGSGAGAGYGAPPPSTSGGASTAPAGAAMVSTADGDLGVHLVGPDGRTLYLFEKDTGSTSTCTGACAQEWPPLLTTGPPAAGGEARAGLLGTTARDDGTMEVTYAGHPLYTYAGDTAPGQTAGQGLDTFGAEWYVLAPSGDAIEDEG